jgi:hypothetical protein
MSIFDRLFRPTKPVTILRSGSSPTHSTAIPATPSPRTADRLVSEPKTRQTYRVPPELRRAIHDADGQPNPHFNAWRRNDRAVHELIGFAKGILADGIVMPDEVIDLSRWILANAEPDSGWPIDVVCHRLNLILAHDTIEPEECEDLAHLLRDLVSKGGAPVPTGYNASTALPFTQPPPTPLEFSGRFYVLTGKFYYGPRTRCEQAIAARGGICSPSVTHKTNVLVIGSIGSRDWVHTSFGTKISHAIESQRKGNPIAIVGEEHWTRFLS